MDGIDRKKLDDVTADVGAENGLTGHGKNRFRTMTRTVLQRLEPMIAASIDERVAEKLGAERERIAAILDAPEATDREETARRLALSSDIAPDKAIEILASTPKAQRTGPTPLDIAMRGQSPNVSADDGTADFTAEQCEMERAANQIINAE